MKLENSKTFWSLVRAGIGHNSLYQFSSHINKIDWNAIKSLANEQGLYAIVLDGIERLSEGQRPPKELLLGWIGEVLRSYENRYERYRRAIAELAGFYNSHGFKMMVLKGYACSLDWPKPEHRPCGDIDIWQFGKQKEADAALLKANTNDTDKTNSFKIDTSHHHHTVFYWHDFVVENHYDFINVHHHKSHAKLEKVLKELGKDDSHFVEVYGEKVYIPSPNLHALFLLKHLMLHFSTGEINLRQVLDWAFFVEKHGNEVDWKWLLPVLDEYHMRDFFNIINAITVEDLGFDYRSYPYIQYNPFLKDRVMSDILSPEFAGDKPKKLFARVVWKIRRWKANSWKHELCYKESMRSAFWSGVWGHLLKPSSI